MFHPRQAQIATMRSVAVLQYADSMPSMTDVKATVYFRKPGPFFSVEEVFGTLLEHLPAAGVNARRVSAPASGTRPPRLLRNILWARRQQGEVNHITGDIHYVALGMDARRTILTVLDARPIEGPPSAKKLLLRQFWFRWPVRRSAVVVAISEETRSRLLRYAPGEPGKIRVIPCCLSPRFAWCPRPFPSCSPQILLVGTTDNKNLLRIADALEGLDCRTKLLGQPTAEQAKRFQEKGVLLEWVAGLDADAVVRLYEDSDIVCFPSTYEGFGMPIIEANAVGRPVVTSACSSMPEVAGDAAVLVDPFDVRSIREGVLRVMESDALREELVEKGRRNALRFHPDAIARQYADLYREVAAKAGRRR